MNIELPFMPVRPAKPREAGLTMMMDKGLSLREAENFAETAGEFTDLLKFGFGTGVFAKNVGDKIKVYREANIRAYFGGTMFEAFVVRGLFDEFRRFIARYKVEICEVSDGSIALPHDEKLEYIRTLAQDVQVLSEVGSKMKGVTLSPETWVQSMQSERQAGSWKVIAEARESGNCGIYHSDGSADTELISLLDKTVGHDNILWEAPNKPQQVWFINHFGANVNVGNIATGEIVALEALRLGLRGDTFFNFLPNTLFKFKQI